jgi:hypothetical protein
MDPSIWMSFEDASIYLTALGEPYRIGFVFTAEDPFFFYDIDKCIDDDGNFNDVAKWSVQAFAGAAIERSQSGRGLHIFGTGECPEHGCKNIHMSVELYTEKRFVMLTGTDTTGESDFDCSHVLPTLVNAYFSDAGVEDDGEWNDFPQPGWDGPTDDDLLLAKALNARSKDSAFSGKASFKDLFEANTEALAASYPVQGFGEWDGSAADAAIAQHLAFWTGGHHERIRTLMERSALKREKWDDRGEYYLPKTIRKACAQQTEYFNVNGKKPDPTPTSPGSPSGNTPAPGQSSQVAVMNPGGSTMFVEEQQSYFAGCHYVISADRILVPNGKLLKKSVFDVVYGGKLFILDSTNTKTTTSAYTCFTQSQACRFPVVDGVMFNPQHPQGEIIHFEGGQYANAYVPIVTPRKSGDVSRFLDLARKIVPDDRDREILLSFLAAVVQYPGHKFRYTIVLQGVQGNGKSTLGGAVAAAVGRGHTAKPNAKTLVSSGNQFNFWLFAKTYVMLEEGKSKGGKNGELMDVLKPILTEKVIEYQFKNQDQFTGDNVANWFCMVNGKEDLPLDKNDRRYCIIFSAQQSVEDIAAAGLNTAYWRDYHDWLEEGGSAAITDWLHTKVIEDKYNPKLLDRAPITTSTEEALEVSLDPVETAIQEAIDSEVQGCKGGWISYTALSDHLKDCRVFVTHNHLSQVLLNMGYIKHPGLGAGKNAGRSAFAIAPEGNRKVRLYAKPNTLAATMQTPHAITLAYEKAQGYAVSPNEVFGNGTGTV